MPLNPYLSTAIVAALKAGAEIMEVYDSEIAVELKDDRSPLTEADRRAHKVIASTLTAGFSEPGTASESLDIPEPPGALSTPEAPRIPETPGEEIPLLSEEGKDIPYGERHGWERFWLVDPLDGTKEFIKRNGEFTVNIALIDKGTPVLGVIYVPVKQVLYFGSWEMSSYKLEGIEPARQGAGNEELREYVLQKFQKGAQMLPVENERGAYAVVASRSHLSPETEAIIEEKRKQYGEVETVSMGSSLKLCLVAEGTADLYPRLAPTMEWDTAAGHAIAKYAGCRVYEPETGLELQYNKENLLNPWFIVERGAAVLS